MNRCNYAVALVVVATVAACPKDDEPAPKPKPAASSGVPEKHLEPLELRPDAGPVDASLVIVINGVYRPWTARDLAAVPQVAFSGEPGAAKTAWNLKDVVHKLIGPSAKVTTVVTEGGRRMDIIWDNPDRTPMIRLNRKDQVKVFYVDANSRMLPGGDAKDVKRLEITP